MSGNKGLSILIPIYNFEIRHQLIQPLVVQAKKLGLNYEILCYDDFSSDSIKEKNRKLNRFKHVTYKELPKNYGRSKIRNMLAEDARFSNLLFIDCDSKIIDYKYLENYLIKAFSYDVILGGTTYSEKLDNPDHSLRWKYGRSREERPARVRQLSPFESITLNNLFIAKDTFLNHKLDETITTYGHEDTKFGFMLKRAGISVNHIDNAVEHIGLESNELFLNKTAEGVKNLYRISLESKIMETKLYRSFIFIKKYSLYPVFGMLYKLFEQRIVNNLTSEKPHLFCFDLYKLYLFLREDQKFKTSQ